MLFFMDFTAKNVYFRASDTFYIQIPYMVGSVVSYLPDKLIIPDQSDTFELKVTNGKLTFTREGMESHIIDTVFKPLKNMLTNPSLLFEPPNFLILLGQYRKRIPFKIKFETILEEDNTIHCKTREVSAVGMPIKSFLNRLNIPLTSILNINDVNEAIQMNESEIIIDPSIFVPGLKLKAPIHHFEISKDTFTIQYGNGYISHEKDLECPDGGYVKLDGGQLQVNPFSIKEPDVLIWSPHYPFVITYDGYPYLFAAGQTEIKLNKEIILRLPDLNKNFSPEKVTILNMILPPHLKIKQNEKLF